ncbi:response regulator transcription factor [Faecalimicrobium sp. JNUCC 81]
MKNILLLEDDESLNSGISFMLKREGHNVFSAFNIGQANEFFYKNDINLIISDINLPDGDGLLFCEEVRKTSDVFIIFLTALDEEVNIVNGYNVGGDDYITKPFSLIVLISKVNAFMKRVSKEEYSFKYMVSKDITFYLEDLKLIKNNEEITLTKNEYKLLKYMMENSKQILTKDQLLDCIWECDGQFVHDNAVAVNIKRLREKVEDDIKDPIYIKNVRGVGYIWAEGCVKK